MVRGVSSVLAALATAVTAFQHFNSMDNLAASIKAQSPQTEEPSATELFFDKQLLDHADDAKGGKPKYWSHRYFVNNAYYKGAGSPVFLYIEGEDPADPFWISKHRFYGRSQPLPDWTVESLKYLTMRQAVDDIAHFQDFLIESRNLTKDSKWVTFGGSYPGQITAYTKLFYPKRFAGAVASSATIDLITDYPGYADSMAYLMKEKGGQSCLNTLREGLKAFHGIIESNKTEDQATLKRLFNPCDAIANDRDKAVLEASVFYRFRAIVQSNDPDLYNVESVYTDLNAQNGLTPLEKVAKVNARSFSKFFNCTGSNYESNYLGMYSGTESDDTNSLRQYQWTMCLEAGGAQTTPGSSSPFNELEYMTLDNLWYSLCKDAYGLSRERVDASMKKSQEYFQGLHPNVKNVVFSGGSYDPWRGLILNNSSVLRHNSSKVVYIEGGAHCGDMIIRPSTNTASMAWARQAIEAKVREFVGLY
ncbi:hypothetical protein Ae201684P_019943 [Aphanomyces euteiches]|uniref:Uncharacterized protein n=1 Tax=Aphanomyces euteiches TaxID=100861 RepID=A0A6G0XE83_9STRA|nr:hypothetical protein Ae201684_005658 [Aphanomyces euteiches]KAH9078878.1 hypothetical protein Ae201684P_019943 [Aphanomyces euteiches]KAH9136388.1 hypothetical protein AeRB84_018436 [Aphanomyces euteiches]